MKDPESRKRNLHIRTYTVIPLNETNGIIESHVGIVKHGTTSLLVQSGLDTSWCAEAMECFCFLKNVHDLTRSGETAYFKRFKKPYKG